MIDKNLVRFLQFRKQVIDTLPLEEKYGIKLPPIYKSFISVFNPCLAFIKVKRKNDDGFQGFVYPFYASSVLETYTYDDDESFTQF